MGTVIGPDATMGHRKDLPEKVELRYSLWRYCSRGFFQVAKCRMEKIIAGKNGHKWSI